MAKHRIVRLAPHQNAKVFAVMMALAALVVAIPMAIVLSMQHQAGAAIVPILLLPVAYLFIGYVTTGAWCMVYNLLGRRLGGIEFETDDSPN